MKAFKNSQKIKDKYISRVQAHYKADEIVHGIYWENGKGCAVGCTIEGSDHSKYETQLGIPKTIAYLEDRIFEGLDNGDSKKFPLKFLESINVGADLSLVTSRFMIWLLTDKKDGVIKYARPDGKKAIQLLADLYTRKLNGEKIKDAEWLAARRAAAAAADAAAAAAYAAAAAAADAAAAAAYAAAAAADAARSSHYKKMAKKLLQLLKESK